MSLCIVYTTSFMYFVHIMYSLHHDYYIWHHYGVPLGPLAISSLAFLFKNKNARFSHENPERVCNLDLLKNARLEIARVRGRGSEILAFYTFIDHDKHYLYIDIIISYQISIKYMLGEDNIRNVPLHQIVDIKH